MYTTVSTAIKDYRIFKDDIDFLKKQCKEKVTRLEKLMDVIENYLKNYFAEHNIDHVSTPEGTAYKTTITNYNVTDKELFLSYVFDNKCDFLVTIKPKKDGVKDYIEVHNGDYPPGLDSIDITNINVRK